MGMSVWCLILDFTSIVDTVLLTRLATKAVLPSGVKATPRGAEPTGMSVGFFFRVFASIVDTELLALLVTKTVARQLRCAPTAEAPFGIAKTSAPANPSAATAEAKRKSRIPGHNRLSRAASPPR